jgi:tetratricopeptide (TPR) repeat protein
MNARTASLKSALAAVTVFVLCAAAAADIIYLNTGGVVKGQILDEDEDRVIIKTTCGEIPVNRDNIDFIEKGTDREILEQRLAKINKTSTDSYFDLGLWAQSVGLEKEALELFRRAIELEPDNVFARQELGHRKHQGKWLTRDEYNAAIGLVKYAGEWVTKEDAEKLKAGYIRYGDEWLKKEDLEMARKGFRKLDGKWVNEEEYYKAKGFVRYGNKWVTQAEHEKFKKQDEERARQEKSLQLSKQIQSPLLVRT